MYNNTIKCEKSQSEDINNLEIINDIRQRMIYKENMIPYYHAIMMSDNQKKYIKECGNYLVLQNNKIIKANFCKNRICPVCNLRKSRKIWGKIYNHILTLSNIKYVLITLTVKNCSMETITSTLDDLMESFKRLTNRKSWKRAILGYIRGTEITYNSSSHTYHPHIHCLCAVDEDRYYPKSDIYISHEKLKQMWEESANLDYSVQVDIRLVKEQESAVAEVAKYAVKMADILKENKSRDRLFAVKTLYHALYNRRLMSSAGILKLRKLDDINMIDYPDENVEEKIMYEFRNGRYNRIMVYNDVIVNRKE